MAEKSDKQLKVTLTRSQHNRQQAHKDCVRGLGLRRMHQSVVLPGTPENLGMIRKVSYLLSVEEVQK